MSEYVELYIDKGTDFSTTIDITDDNTNLPQDLAGVTIRSSLKRSLVSPNVYASFVCTTDVANLNGTIQISMNAANTAALKVGTYFFDVITIDTGNTHSRLIEGVVHVTPSITG